VKTRLKLTSWCSWKIHSWST